MKRDDSGLYAELAVPFADATEADDALKAFFDDVYAARVKHRIADVQVIVQVSTARASGGSQHGMASAYYGDPMANKLPLIARVYGEARQEHEEVLGQLISHGRQTVKARA